MNADNGRSWLRRMMGRILGEPTAPAGRPTPTGCTRWGKPEVARGDGGADDDAREIAVTGILSFGKQLILGGFTVEYDKGTVLIMYGGGKLLAQVGPVNPQQAAFEALSDGSIVPRLLRDGGRAAGVPVVMAGQGDFAGEWAPDLTGIDHRGAEGSEVNSKDQAAGLREAMGSSPSSSRRL